MSKFSRRDFLKIAGMASGALAASQVAPRFLTGNPGGQPNMIILVLDAMSARNLSLYGYKRKTTPNFERFAERATTYHAHVSGGNFTSPGTASLLTGTYPWTHRAFNISGLIKRENVLNNIFTALGSEYHRLAYSQNLLPNYFFGQFEQDIDTILKSGSFSLIDQTYGSHFPTELAAGTRALDSFLFQDGEIPASLVFGLANRLVLRSREARTTDEDYPRGLPRAGDHPIFFRLRDVFDGVMSTLDGVLSPYLAYLHLWAPHEPYKPTKEFDNKFLDNFRPEPKPDHRLGDHAPNAKLNGRRQNYDEYIANVDAEFGRLLDHLASTGALDQSYLIVTSDHGQIFERGVEGHVTKLLYEPLTHIPLIISAPGQITRQDIYSPTSAVDILPTLLHFAGRDKPVWTEGELLPGFGGVEDPQRSLFTLEAKTNTAFAPLTKATIAMRKGNYKMIYYTGFEAQDAFELYDILGDSGELQDLYPAQPRVASAMREELLDKLSEVNAAYKRV
jgi:arylsulfatase A-like enzyme